MPTTSVRRFTSLLRGSKRLVEQMRARKIGIILAANYFDEQKIRTVAARVNAKPVIVPLYVGGAAGVEDYFRLVDHWTDRLLEAAK